MTGLDVDSDLVGVTLDDRYHLEEVVGTGGMGRVYRGTQLAVDRDVAIKVLHERYTRDDTVARRFLREAEVVSEFSHPNIVNLVDFGVEDDRDVIYLVMELLEGRKLGETLEGYRCRPALAVEIIDQVGAALTEPHRDGVVHRDLKPDNLMLQTVTDGSLQTKVLDFGVARVAQANMELTQTDAVCGTPYYMSPEQVQNGDVGPKADLYGLGTVAFELLAGRPPIEGDSSFEVMRKHLEYDPPSLSDLEQSIPPQLDELVSEMLEKQPERRPESANAVRRRIDEFRREEGISRLRIDPELPLEDALEPWLEPHDDSADPPGGPIGDDVETNPDEVASTLTGTPNGEVPDPETNAPDEEDSPGRSQLAVDTFPGADSYSTLYAVAAALFVLGGVTVGVVLSLGTSVDASSEEPSGESERPSTAESAPSNTEAAERTESTVAEVEGRTGASESGGEPEPSKSGEHDERAEDEPEKTAGESETDPERGERDGDGRAEETTGSAETSEQEGDDAPGDRSASDRNEPASDNGASGGTAPNETTNSTARGVETGGVESEQETGETDSSGEQAGESGSSGSEDDELEVLPVEP